MHGNKIKNSTLPLISNARTPSLVISVNFPYFYLYTQFFLSIGVKHESKIIKKLLLAPGTNKKQRGLIAKCHVIECQSEETMPDHSVLVIPPIG